MTQAGEWHLLAAQLRADLTLAPGFGPVLHSRSTIPQGWVAADGTTLLPETPHSALRQAYLNDNCPFGQDLDGNPKLPLLAAPLGVYLVKT